MPDRRRLVDRLVELDLGDLRLQRRLLRGIFQRLLATALRTAGIHPHIGAGFLEQANFLGLADTEALVKEVEYASRAIQLDHEHADLQLAGVDLEAVAAYIIAHQGNSRGIVGRHESSLVHTRPMAFSYGRRGALQ